eukprot:s1807_g12.t1
MFPRERQLAHEEAARALNSGDLNLIQKAMKQVNFAGGPAKDRQHLAQILEMGDDRSSVTSVLPRGQPLTPAAWEAFREREEQLLQHLKEDRENQLGEFRTEAEKIHAAALQAAQTAQARTVRDEPARSLPGGLREAVDEIQFREDASAKAPFRSAPDRLQDEAQSGFQPGWTNPFGLDPAKEVFDPFGVPAYDYRTLLTNAQLRTQMHGKPFEHPDFWNVRGSKASNEEVRHDPEFHVSLQAQRRRRLGLEDPHAKPLVATSRFVSLGTSCSVAAALQALGVRGEAGPFDWLRRSVGWE